MKQNQKDLTLKTAHGMFNFRIGYLIFNGNKILLQKHPNDNYWFITGGRVEFGDDTKETVIREISEELSLDVTNLDLAGLIENFFNLEGHAFHELATFYRVKIAKDFEIPTHEANGKEIHLEWHALDSLKHLDIRPSFLKDHLHKFKNGFLHYIHKEEKKGA